ncbi:MAG: sodium:proton antiporter [Alphaproteobacteria bacterium]
MTVFQTIALLLTFAALGAYINHRFLKLPSTIGLMVFALLISLGAVGLNYLGIVNLTSTGAFVSQINFSEILLHGMLSFLLFAGAMHVDLSELKKYQGIVGALATGGVVITTLVTGTIVWQAAQWFGFQLPYIYALLFGALIAPTDPVAVLGILKQTGISRRFLIKIGGESLLNDGAGIVLFMVLLNIADPTTPNMTPMEITGLFLWEGIGSIILGLTLGWITFRFLIGIDDYKIEALLTLALAAGGYSLAEAVHVSAPITMVVAGLVIGNHGRMFGMSDRTRTHLDMFWELLDEILNAVLFMLMGLQMMVFTISSQHIALGLAAIIAMLIGRFISVSIPVYLLHFRYSFERGTIPILTWGGLRGGIAIALALSLPAGFEKDLILGMTYIAVVFSVLFQGTTFRYVARAILKKKA